MLSSLSFLNKLYWGWAKISMRVFKFLIVGFFVSFAFTPQGIASAFASDTVRVFTHGQNKFVALGSGGNFKGRGVDLLRCGMMALGQKFSIDQVAMVRKERMAQQGTMDAWLPSYVDGSDKRKSRIVYPIGQMGVYWYLRKNASWDPSSAEFKAKAKVAAFPGSSPERILRQEGYQYQHGTEDENTVILWLVEGRLDGFLGANFEYLLKPGASTLLNTRIKQIFYKKFDVGIEFTDQFVQKQPKFIGRFQKALTACQ